MSDEKFRKLAEELYIAACKAERKSLFNPYRAFISFEGQVPEYQEMFITMAKILVEEGVVKLNDE